MILYSGSLWSFAPKFGKLLIAIRFLDLDLMKKLYCYVDETGQDTQGKFFLVCVVVVDATFRDRVEKRLLAIEKRSKKGHVEWTRISLPKKNAYLQELLVSSDTISYEVSGHELLRIIPQKRSLCFYVSS